VRPRPDLLDLRDLTTVWRIRRDTRGADRGLASDNVPIIPGRRGNVTAHDRETLCVYLRGRRHLARVLRELPAGWRRHQVGDDEANLLAPVSDLDRAADIVRAYRRPRLTDEQRAVLSERARQAKLGQFRALNAPRERLGV
jgi:hypothetical protein